MYLPMVANSFYDSKFTARYMYGEGSIALLFEDDYGSNNILVPSNATHPIWYVRKGTQILENKVFILFII